MAQYQKEFEAPLSHLRSLPFVQNLRFVDVFRSCLAKDVTPDAVAELSV
jgi:hypothetical protein